MVGGCAEGKQIAMHRMDLRNGEVHIQMDGWAYIYMGGHKTGGRADGFTVGTQVEGYASGQWII